MGFLSFFSFHVTLAVERHPVPTPPPSPHLSFTLLQKYYSVHLKSSKGSSFSIHAAVYQFPCFTFLKKGRSQVSFRQSLL